MWRAVFALAHADGVVTDEEKEYMNEVLASVPFSEEQHATLKEDIYAPRDIVEMFSEISEQEDQALFFKFAKEIVHADGEYDTNEQHVLLRLKAAHVRGTNIDDLVGKIDMEFEEDPVSASPHQAEKKCSKGVVSKFKSIFFGEY